MDLKNIFFIILLSLIVLQTVNADSTYNIDGVRNLETSIHIGGIQENQYLTSEIDGRNIEEEAPSGGYIGDGEYLLPYDLGLGKHTLNILIKDEWGETVKTSTYQFCIVKADEDPSVYDDYSPYYYSDEINDEQLEEDYQDFMISQTFTEDNDDEIETIEHPTLLKVNVNIGTLERIDETLTSVMIP